MVEQVLLKALEYARVAVVTASEKQAADILLLDIRSASSFADYFVIMTADSSRQINSLAEEVAESLEEAGAKLHHREGSAKSGWVLLDFGDVIVHLFGREEREFYALENVWKQTVEVVRLQ
ncbi:MAG: ribosome silencing factor [Chloroflexi bacterium]|nr:ribosome silencing factor [Chloroflexota bacterium]